MNYPYQVVRRGTSFTAHGPTPDQVLSKHRTYEAARRAFDRIDGRAQLIGPDGKMIDHRII